MLARVEAAAPASLIERLPHWYAALRVLDTVSASFPGLTQAGFQALAQARLTAQGLAPGVHVHVLQRAPTYVIEVGETSIALERRVAEAIALKRS